MFCVHICYIILPRVYLDLTFNSLIENFRRYRYFLSLLFSGTPAATLHVPPLLFSCVCYFPVTLTVERFMGGLLFLESL